MRLADPQGWSASPSMKRLLRWLTVIWVTASLLAIGWQVVAHWPRIAAEPVGVDVLLLSLASTLAAKFFSALQVRRSLLVAGVDVPERTCFFAYSMADLAKYIPGGVWGFVGRLALYRRLRIGVSAMAHALVIEQAWLVLGAAAVGSCLYGRGRWGEQSWLLGAVAAILLGWLGAMLMLQRLDAPGGRSGSLAAVAAIQAALWLCAAAGFSVLMPAEPLASGGAFCIAFALGLLVPFAPSGIGVREASAALLLLPLVPVEAIMRALILSRGVWILADVIFTCVVCLLCRQAWSGFLREQAEQSQ